MVLVLLSKSRTFSYFNNMHKFTRPVVRSHLSPNTYHFFLSRLKCYKFHIAVLGLHAYVRVCNVQLCCRVIQLCYRSHYAVNPLNAELNPNCCLLALLGAHHFLHVSRIRVKSLTLRLLMSYIYMTLVA